MTSIFVPPLGRAAQILDRAATPIMQLLTGAHESPQRTHFWNNIKLSIDDVEELNRSHMVETKGSSKAKERWLWKFPLFHVPILGGWRDYIVLQSLHIHSSWYVGWITDDVIGVSQHGLSGAVRVLEGRGPARFFGITADGRQVPIKEVGRGRLGDGSPFAEITLL